MKTIARWILVVPAAVLGMYIGLFLGMLMFRGLVIICPSQYQVSGSCIAGLGRVAKDGVMIFTTSLSAILVVSFATLMAPRHKVTVAWIAYLAGALFVTFLAYDTGFGLPYFGAIVCGLLTVLYVHQRRARRKLVSWFN